MVQDALRLRELRELVHLRVGFSIVRRSDT
jgi:hypothetical protein